MQKMRLKPIIGLTLLSAKRTNHWPASLSPAATKTNKEKDRKKNLILIRRHVSVCVCVIACSENELRSLKKVVRRIFSP